ncbi:MAG: hypothetical protein U9N51_05125 [Bacteroidota bacterium]|nr:hypothetical protein [Bacteroidota bacterium]
MKTVLAVLIILVFVMSSCEKKTYYDVDFFVKNICEEQIKVDYSVRVCSSIDNDCSPHNFSDLINVNQSMELYVKDDMSDDGKIEDVFYEFEIFKGSEKSNLDIWNSEKLIETKYDERIEYILIVDSTYFE